MVLLIGAALALLHANLFHGAVGRTVDAPKLREQTLALQRAKLGQDHRDTLSSMNNLANIVRTSPTASTPLPMRGWAGSLSSLLHLVQHGPSAFLDWFHDPGTCTWATPPS